MTNTTDNSDLESHWVSESFSDRIDELRDEIDETQVRQLYDALKTTSAVDWFRWVLNAREEIAQYDFLSAAERHRRLRKPDALDALKLQHACIFVEYWRMEMRKNGDWFPPTGPPVDEPDDQRRMILAMSWAEFQLDADAYWPFDYCEDGKLWPFASGNDSGST